MPLAPTLLQAQQYTIDDNQIIVDTKQHWEAWEVKAGISSITQDGSISPRFLRKQVNAALDTPGFAVQLQGVVAAGSNEEDAHLLIDGDPQTYWGPDLAEPEQAWWVQIKLGRLVERAIIQPDVSFEVVFGVSDSTWSLYELEHGRRAIGYYPEDMSIIDPEN